MCSFKIIRNKLWTSSILEKTNSCYGFFLGGWEMGFAWLHLVLISVLGEMHRRDEEMPSVVCILNTGVALQKS